MSTTTPPFVGIIESTGDALILFEASRRGLVPRITRRLLAKEQATLIKSGSIFIFDERESGIKRWTDGLIWSPSRIQSNFLLYRETTARTDRHHPNLPNRSSKSRTKQPSISSLSSVSASSSSLASPDDVKRDLEGEDEYDEKERVVLPIRRRRKKGGGWTGPVVGASEQERERELVGSLTGTYRFRTEGLVKKSISIHINGVAQHLVSYYSMEDAMRGVLRSPSSFPELASLTIHPAYLEPHHFRFPPSVVVGADGVTRYDESELASPPPLSSLAPQPSSSQATLDRTPTRPSLASKRRSSSPSQSSKVRKLRISLPTPSTPANEQDNFVATEHAFEPSPSFGQHPTQHSRSSSFHIEPSQIPYHHYPQQLYHNHYQHPLDASSASGSTSTSASTLPSDPLESPGGIGLSLEGMELIADGRKSQGENCSEEEESFNSPNARIDVAQLPHSLDTQSMYTIPLSPDQIHPDHLHHHQHHQFTSHAPFQAPYLGLYPSSNPPPSHLQLPPHLHRPSLPHQSSEPIFTFPYARSYSSLDAAAPHSSYVPHQFQHFPLPPPPSSATRPLPHHPLPADAYSAEIPAYQAAAQMYEVPIFNSRPQQQVQMEDGRAWEGGMVQGGEDAAGLITCEGWGRS